MEENEKESDIVTEETGREPEGEDGYGSCCEEEKALVDREEVLSNPG